LREDAAAFYQEGVRLRRHLFDRRVDRLGEPLGQLHVDHIRLGFLDAHRGAVGCDASQTGLCLRADDDAAEARASMFAALTARDHLLSARRSLSSAHWRRKCSPL